ncbi:MAG: archease [Patescibacteria group bacterium]|nr:archease [Patescibacteria group bacterium]
MKLEGSNFVDLFESGLEGVFDFLRPTKGEQGQAVVRTISVSSTDKTALLVDFLSEAVRLALSNREAYGRTSFDELSSTALKANLYGEKVEGFADDIKAVTYHRADVRQNSAGRWETEIVCDI